MSGLFQNRILLTVGFALAVLTVLIFSVSMYREHVESDLEQTLAMQIHTSIALGRLSASVEALPLSTRLAVNDLSAAPERISKDREIYTTAIRELELTQETIASMPKQPAFAAAWRTFTEHLAASRIGQQLVWSAISDGNSVLARNRLAADEGPDAETAAALTGIRSAYDPEGELGALRDTHTNSVWFLILTLAVGGTATLILLRLLTGSLDARVHALRNGAARMAIGALDADFDDVSGDELGTTSRLMRDVALFKRRIAHLVNEVSEGDTSVVIPSRGSEDDFAAAIIRIVGLLRDVVKNADRITSGDLTNIEPRSSRDAVGTALGRMAKALRDKAAEVANVDWLKTGIARLNDVALGEDNLDQLSTNAITCIAEHMGAQVGALFVFDADSDGPLLRIAGTHAYTHRKSAAPQFRLGEGLVGQVAREKKPVFLRPVPDGYLQVVSGLGESSPEEICVLPVLFKDELRGVLEVATLRAATPIQIQFLEQAAIVIGSAYEIARNKAIVEAQQRELQAYTEELERQKEELQATAETLKTQQVELEQTNAEVEAQMRRAVQSEERMKIQQAELEIANGELEIRNVELERQKAEIEVTRKELATRAEELSIASKYKSEFFANMSHELRTPLNSLLLLARSLKDNDEGNLLGSQVEAASVIYDSGNDLLNLINEILDLAKVESGRMELRLETCLVSDIVHTLNYQFDHMARSQGLAFSVSIAPDIHQEIITDPNRLGQVLKNLVGNAIKFTDQGSVRVEFTSPNETEMAKLGLTKDKSLAIRIIDTGIGIPSDKQMIIFEAFQQADSGDRRRFGGTGLGLSISRTITGLLGGEILLESEPGRGSTFSIIIPTESAPIQLPQIPVAPSAAASATPPVPKLAPRRNAPSVSDDRDTIDERDRVILIIEDDAPFCTILVTEVRNRGFRCLASNSGEDGLELAKQFRPIGIILDLNLPGMDGWTVLSRLKQDIETRHIPVHIVSSEDASLEGLRIGAIGHAHKPLNPSDISSILATIEHSIATAEKHVLVVEDDPLVRKETMKIVGNGNVHVHGATGGVEALTLMSTQKFDLIVLDLGLADMQGLEMLQLASESGSSVPPVIIYTARDLTSSEEMALRQYAETIIIKDVRSTERLVDEVALFLHRVVNDLPQDKRSTIRHLHESDDQLRGKSILIVEDDMRTMFAMAKLLASHGINPLKAADGSQALSLLATEPVDLVLLDMMMPVMDGYETASRIRADTKLAKLPIIALTAKAMREDRQRCIEAGASDYLTKPVDQDRLLALLRIWLCR
jgi:CheY-like chemotaxis protein/signal transduction histidine kinase